MSAQFEQRLDAEHELRKLSSCLLFCFLFFFLNSVFAAVLQSQRGDVATTQTALTLPETHSWLTAQPLSHRGHASEYRLEFKF